MTSKMAAIIFVNRPRIWTQMDSSSYSKSELLNELFFVFRSESNDLLVWYWYIKIWKKLEEINDICHTKFYMGRLSSKVYIYLYIVFSEICIEAQTCSQYISVGVCACVDYSKFTRGLIPTWFREITCLCSVSNYNNIGCTYILLWCA